MSRSPLAEDQADFIPDSVPSTAELYLQEQTEEEREVELNRNRARECARYAVNLIS